MRNYILPEIGTKFFDWTVIDNQPVRLGKGRKHTNVLVRCKCGKEALRQVNGLRQGSTKMCRSCATKEQYKEGAHKYFRHPIRKLIGEISGSYFSHIKGNARRRGIEFDLSMEFLWELFLKQEGKCKLSGLPLFIEKSYSHKDKYHNHTASLDRIDSSKGYTEDNVQWVHKRVNSMKNDMSDKEFIELCKTISKYN